MPTLKIRTVDINTLSPVPCVIEIDGRVTTSTGETTIEVGYGKYSLKIRAEGYEPVNTVITIKREREEVTVPLIPRVGLL